MGIQVEFNPDLALRDYSEYEKGNRLEDECLPKELEVGDICSFLKKGQRLYYLSDDENWYKGEIPLFKTEGEGRLSRPLASIKIIEATHYLDEGEVYTKGKYKVIDIFNPEDSKINFEAMKRVK